MNLTRGQSQGTVCFIALAVALFLVTFLPWSTWLGYTSAEEIQGYSHTFRAWLLWTAAILAVALALNFIWRDGIERHLERWRAKLLGFPGRGYALACAVVFLAAAALLSSLLFARNPHNVDSIAQLFQARIFLGGGLTAPAPEYPEFFGATHLLIQEGRWFSQYPPGQPKLSVSSACATLKVAGMFPYFKMSRTLLFVMVS